MAKGSKARRFRAQLDSIGQQAELKMTRCAGDARTLAAEAASEGFTCVVAAGGDGTLNEVINGVGDVSDGFGKVAVGVLPLGTVNVFARELGIPLDLGAAWQVVLNGRVQQLDLAHAEFLQAGQVKRWFAQLGGAGLDARAIELVSWELKKRFGPLAYIFAGLRALREEKPLITAASEAHSFTGELVLVGNGRLYGGNFRTFDQAAMDDGLLDVCVFPKVNFFTLFQAAGPLLLKGKLPESIVQRFQAPEFTLTSGNSTPFELEGEFAGHLPVRFAVVRRLLRAIVP